jgi:hypothetical protein
MKNRRYENVAPEEPQIIPSDLLENQGAERCGRRCSAMWGFKASSVSPSPSLLGRDCLFLGIVGREGQLEFSFAPRHG